MPRENIWSLSNNISYITLEYDSDLNLPNCFTIETSNHNNEQFMLQVDKNQAMELMNSICRFYGILPNFHQINANGNIVMPSDTSRVGV